MNKKAICFKTIETHTLGEPTRIVTEGFPKYAAKSMMEYKEYLENNYDQYRSAHMCEPRGHKDMVGAGDYGGRTQAQGNCSTDSKGADMLWRKRKEAGSSGGNICLAYNGNEDVDPG